MATITFKNGNAHTVFHSMTEGMWEVQRDDGALGVDTPRAKALAMVLDSTPWKEGDTYPLSFTLPNRCLSAARDVLANCDDNRENWETDLDDENPDEPERDFIVEGEIVIEGGISTHGADDCAAAMLNALEAIERAYGGDIPEEFQGTVKTLEAILAQQGCAHFGEGDRLTDLMDVVIFG